MGAAACGGRGSYGGKGFKGRAVVSGERPMGAARCTQQHTRVSCQPPPPRNALEGGEVPPPPPGRLAYAQPLPPSRQVPASMAFVTDSNRPQPLRKPPPTACPTASRAPLRSLPFSCIPAHPPHPHGVHLRSPEPRASRHSTKRRHTVAAPHAVAYVGARQSKPRSDDVGVKDFEGLYEGLYEPSVQSAADPDAALPHRDSEGRLSRSGGEARDSRDATGQRRPAERSVPNIDGVLVSRTESDSLDQSTLSESKVCGVQGHRGWVDLHPFPTSLSVPHCRFVQRPGKTKVVLDGFVFFFGALPIPE